MIRLQIPRRSLAHVLVAFALVACMAPDLVPPLSPAQPQRPETASPVETGHVRLAIRWPASARTVQLIPDSTRFMDLRVVQGERTVATASLRFPASEVVLGPVPTGTSRLEAEAFHAPLPADPTKRSDNLVATGSVEVNILPNVNVNAALTLDPTRVPDLNWLEPAEGPAGGSVILRGRLLKAPPGGETSVIINGTQLASTSFTVFNDSLTITEMPALGDTLTLRIVVDGVAGNRTLTYRVVQVRGLKLSPAVLRLTRVPDSDQYAGSFDVLAYRDVAPDHPIEVPVGLTWDILDEDPPRLNPTDASVFELNDSTMLARGTTPATATIRVRYGDSEATASVVYDPS